MKLLVLACFLGIAAASLVEKAAPKVDESVLAFLKGSLDAGSLQDALGIHEDWVAKAGDDVTSELGKQLKEALDKLLEHIQEHIDHGKGIGNDLMEKVKELREKLKEAKGELGEKAKELIEKIKNKAREHLKELLEKLGLGKRNLDEELDVVARGKFSDFLENLVEKITTNENIQRLREYIRRIESDNPLVHKWKEVVESLRDVDLKEIIRQLLTYKPGQRQSRDLKETWEKVKNFFKDINVKIQEHSKKFGEWVKDMWGKGMDKLKDKYGAVKAIAIEFIAHAKDTSAEVAREALEFFRPYKEDLGALWDQIVEASKQAIGKF